MRGVRDALLEKLKNSDLKIEDKKVTKIAEEIEIAMFGTFGEAGSKYKNKFRSLTFNIKDSKNDGLYRRILLKDLQPIEVVQMSAADYASKELQQWRKAAAQKDIEAIKSHELEKFALGNTFVMKSHKGEQVIEKSDQLVSSSSEPVTDLTLLPEEQDAAKDSGTNMDTADPALTKEKDDAKRKEKKERRHKDKHRERHSSSKSHSHSSKDKKHSRDRDKERSSHKSSGSEKERKHSSKSHSSSSKSKKDKSRDKERSSSSKSSGEKKETEIPKPMSSEVPPVREEPDMSELQAQINKATAAIEAAKKSVVDTISHTEPEVASESRPGSPLDLDLPCEGSWLEGEVSSTVTINTPDQPESWAGNTAGEPSVWEGQVSMQDVAKFSVSAFQVSGTSDYLRWVVSTRELWPDLRRPLCLVLTSSPVWSWWEGSLLPCVGTTSTRSARIPPRKF